MFRIARNKIITITRGDSFEFIIHLDTGSPLYPVKYVLDENDTVYLAVCEPNSRFEQAIIRKKYSVLDSFGMELRDDVLYAVFDPSDTENLSPGVYYYEIKVKHDDPETGKADVATLVGKTKFIILE